MPHDLFITERALNAANLLPLYHQYGGPIWVYEAETISARIAQLRRRYRSFRPENLLQYPSTAPDAQPRR